MAKTTKIGWTARPNPAGVLEPGATYNPWIGCTKIAPECANCYAATQDHHRRWTPDGWGKGRARYFTGDSALSQIRTLNRKSNRDGFRRAVFCASLSDVFDPEVPDERRDQLFGHIATMDALEWLILTKRPGLAGRYLERVQGWPWPHVRLGVSAGTVETWNRNWPVLAGIPAASRFVSMGPLLEPVPMLGLLAQTYPRPDWIIVEGESADPMRTARPMNPNWVREIRFACWNFGVPFYFKQWGEWCPLSALDHNPQAKGIILSGSDIHRHEFPDGETVHCVGVGIANNYLDGKRYEAIPRAIPIDKQTEIFDRLKP